MLTAAAVLWSCTAGVVSAQTNATWAGGNGGDPTEWFEPLNWSPNTVPNGTATFSTSATTSVAVDGLVNIATVQFISGASAFTISTNDFFLVNGTGIFNNSANPQTFDVTTNAMVFQNASTASGGSNAVSYTNSVQMVFSNGSTAGSANITNNGDIEFNNTSNAGTATIANNATVNFNGSSSAATGTITNAASGTVSFNLNATAGTATINNSGDLLFGNSATAGGSNITNVGNGTIEFTNSSSAGNATIASSLVGGSITFSNTSTAANATIVLKESNLVFNDSASAGSATITMPDATHPGTITFNNTSTAGTANITVIGSTGIVSSLSFLDASTAAGATITNNPGIGSGGQTIFGRLGGTDTANAGTATIINNSAGTTSFLAHTSAMNATITNNNGGSTNFQDQSTAGSATIVNNGGTTNFGVPIVGTDTATAGNASITDNAGGTTFFTAATTAGNAVIANEAGGIVQFGDSGIGSSTASAGNSSINNSGVVSFNALTTAGNATITTNSGGNVFFFDSSTGGAAQFVTNAGGTFDMSGLTATGMTAGSIAGAGSYVLGSKDLTVGGNNLSTTVSGVISGVGGALTKAGTGTLTLSGINTYTGPTTVNGGTLSVDGSIASSILTTVNSGGTLAGSGSVGPTSIAGGTLAPGSAGGSVFGPLNVLGNLSFTAASTYMIQVTPASAGRTNVTGTATLGGATVSAMFAPGSYINRQYTILSASSGVSGTFNPAVTTNMPLLAASLSYDPNDVFLNIKLNFIVPGGLNINQQNVANALTNFFNSNGGIPFVYAQLTPAQLTQASGELPTAAQQTTFDAMGLFLGLMTDPFGAGGSTSPSAGGTSSFAEQDALAYAARNKQPSNKDGDAYRLMTKAPIAGPYDPRWSVWGAGFGGAQTTDGNTTLGSNNTTSRVFGTAVGADYLLSPGTVVGFALAGGGTNFSVDNSGSGRSDLFQAGAYVRHKDGPAYINAALAYGWQDITTDRIVTISGFDKLHAEFNANAVSGRVEGGYRYATPWLGLTPYAAAQFTTFDLPSYAEQVLAGTGNFALGYGAKSVTDPRSELGLRSDKAFATADGVLTLRGRLAWAHDFDPNRTIAATFQALPGASFVVNGAAQAHDSALTTLSAEMKWLNGWSAAATFEGEFSAVTTSYAGKAVLRYAW